MDMAQQTRISLARQYVTKMFENPSKHYELLDMNIQDIATSYCKALHSEDIEYMFLNPDTDYIDNMVFTLHCVDYSRI